MKPHRRWYQFTLQTLLLFVVLCAAVLTLWTRYGARYVRGRCLRELLAYATPVSTVREPLDSDGALGVETVAGSNDYVDMSPVLRQLAALERSNLYRVLMELLRPARGVVREDTQGLDVSEKEAQLSELAGVSLKPLEVTTASSGAPWNGLTNPGVIGQFAHPSALVRCFLVNDAGGERLLLVLGRHDQGPLLSPPSGQKGQATQELVLLNLAGGIVSRFNSFGGVLLGRLSEPLGRADQLVFGPATLPCYWLGERKWGFSGTRTICIIKDGRLTVNREIQFGQPPLDHPALVAALEKPLNDEDASVRAGALGTIAQIGEEAKPLVPRVEQLLDDEDELVRTLARDALRSIDPGWARKLR